jgi:hypothetical protein
MLEIKFNLNTIFFVYEHFKFVTHCNKVESEKMEKTLIFAFFLIASFLHFFPQFQIKFFGSFKRLFAHQNFQIKSPVDK